MSNIISNKCVTLDEQFSALADNNFTSRDYNKNAQLQEIRDAIMGGVPDCYPYAGKHAELFKSLAKQPK